MNDKKLWDSLLHLDEFLFLIDKLTRYELS